MLDLMPGLRAQCQFVERGDVPKHIRKHEKRPGKEGMHKECTEFFESGFVEKRPQTRAHKSTRQSRKHRQKRGSLKNQRRRHHSQKKVLHHVDAQQPRGEGIERRC